jgi:hypothetical protein
MQHNNKEIKPTSTVLADTVEMYKEAKTALK